MTQATTATSRRWPFSWRAAPTPRRHPFLRTPPRSRPEWRLTRTRGRHSATRSVAAQTRANSPSALRRARSHLSRRRTLNCRPTLGGNNVYDVTVQVSDGHGGIDTQAIAVSVQNVVGASINGTAGNDVIDRTHTVVGQPFPTSEEDTLNGGAGSDTLAGGAGADTFVFDLTALTPAQPGSGVVDHILDYNQGNSGIFNPAEGDTFDFSALLSAGSGQPVGNLVRVLENPSGTAAILQIDQDGAANGAHWTTIAQLDGVHTGDGVKVIFDASQPAATLTAPALVPTHNFNGDGKADILWQNDSGLPAIWTMDGTNITGWSASCPILGRRGMSLTRPISTATARPIFFGRTTAACRRSGPWTAPTSPAGALLPNPGPTWHVAAAADFNGDGKADILWQHDSGLPAIWTMDGTNVTGWSASCPILGPRGMSLRRPISTATASPIFFGRTTAACRRSGPWTAPTSPAGALLPNPGPTWHVAAAADFNGDGKSDILWQHDSGLPAIWTMDGTNVTGGAAPAQSWAYVACRCGGRFQRRRQGRYSLAARQRLAGDLDHGRHQRHRWSPCPILAATGTYSRAISLALSALCCCCVGMPFTIGLQRARVQRKKSRRSAKEEAQQA